jgi:hypothetical protein
MLPVFGLGSSGQGLDQRSQVATQTRESEFSVVVLAGPGPGLGGGT